MPDLKLVATAENVITDAQNVLDGVGLVEAERAFFESIQTFFTVLRDDLSKADDEEELPPAAPLASIQAHLERALEELEHGSRKKARRAVTTALAAVLVAQNGACH